MARRSCASALEGSIWAPAFAGEIGVLGETSENQPKQTPPTSTQSSTFTRPRPDFTVARLVLPSSRLSLLE